MSWEQPGALWLALAAPVILLLWMLRPRRPRLRVPSLMLWERSPTVRQSARPWQRLRNHPLLWIQLLAALLLALAAARPFLAGADQARQLVVLLDASGSMRATDVAPDRFSAARSIVLDLARDLGPGERITVVRLDQEPRLLVAGAQSESQVRAALEREAPGFGPPDVAATVALAASVAAGPAEWVLVGDGGIAIPEDTRLPPETSFRFVPVGGAAANVAVTGLSLREVAPDVLAVQAALRNTGATAVSGRLQLLAEGELVAAQEWSVEPRAETFVTWTGLSAAPAWYEARISGVAPEANALLHDDEAWAGVPRSGVSSLLLVSPGNLFLERALTLDPRVQAFRAEPSDWSALSSQGAYGMTVLDRMWPEALPRGNVLLVGPPVGPEFAPTEAWPVASHPLLRYVDWSDVHIRAAYRAPLDASWETLVDSDGGPLLAVRTEGTRRQALLTFALDRSDLALRPAFPVLIANLMEWLLPGLDPAPRAVPLGTSFSVDASALSDEVWIELPGGGREELAPPWPPRPFTPTQPGVYRAVEAGPDGERQLVFTTNGYHPLEADLTARSVTIPAPDESMGSLLRGGVAVWPLVAALVLGLSLLEWWLDARGH